jgi:hypothetical protein
MDGGETWILNCGEKDSNRGFYAVRNQTGLNDEQ